MIKFTLSLDKISVILKANTFDLSCKFQPYYDRLIKTHFCREHYSSYKLASYKDNYTFIEQGHKEGIIYVGFAFNDFKDYGNCQKFIKIEFNPNKTSIPLPLKDFIHDVYARYLRVQSCDIAFDFEGLKPADIKYNTRADVMLYGKQNNFTHYTRPKAEHLRCKVYDKTKERAKLGEKIPQTTRIECSLKLPTFHESNILHHKDIEYLQNICRVLSEFQVPCDMPKRIDTLVEKYGPYNEAILYLLDCVSAEEQHEAISRMAKNSQSKYRSYISAGTREPFLLDELKLGEQLSQLLNNTIIDITPRGLNYDNQRISTGFYN